MLESRNQRERIRKKKRESQRCLEGNSHVGVFGHFSLLIEKPEKNPPFLLTYSHQVDIIDCCWENQTTRKNGDYFNSTKIYWVPTMCLMLGLHRWKRPSLALMELAICSRSPGSKRRKNTNNYWGPVSFIHLTKAFEYPLCARYYSRVWRRKGRKDKWDLCFYGIFIPKDNYDAWPILGHYTIEGDFERTQWWQWLCRLKSDAFTCSFSHPEVCYNPHP